MKLALTTENYILRGPAVMSCPLLGWVFSMRWNISNVGQKRGLCTRFPKPVRVLLLKSLSRIGSWRYSRGN